MTWNGLFSQCIVCLAFFSRGVSPVIVGKALCRSKLAARELERVASMQPVRPLSCDVRVDCA